MLSGPEIAVGANGLRRADPHDLDEHRNTLSGSGPGQRVPEVRRHRRRLLAVRRRRSQPQRHAQQQGPRGRQGPGTDLVQE